MMIPSPERRLRNFLLLSTKTGWLGGVLAGLTPPKGVLSGLGPPKGIAFTHMLVMQDFHDDGEGGAGIKIMHLLQDSNVRNVVVIVSRWYGGILLGPARFMYITDAARGVLEQGGYLQQPRAQPSALTNTAADLVPMQESSSSDEAAEVGISPGQCLKTGIVLDFLALCHVSNLHGDRGLESLCHHDATMNDSN